MIGNRFKLLQAIDIFLVKNNWKEIIQTILELGSLYSDPEVTTFLKY